MRLGGVVVDLPKSMNVPYDLALEISALLEFSQDKFSEQELELIKRYIQYIKEKKNALIRRMDYEYSRKSRCRSNKEQQEFKK